MATLQKSVEQAAKIINGHEHARVISHYDADGITSAGIICNALLRRGIQFHATIVNKLERSFIQDLDESLIIICDMGTAQSDLLSENLRKDVVIIDHHAPATSVPAFHASSSSSVLINPCCLRGAEKRELTNERGSTICAAGLSYLVARCMSSGDDTGNIDLAGLAIAGTLGDKLDLETGINRLIVDEAVQEGVVTVKTGLKLGVGKIRDSILFATDPYLPLAGKVEWVDAFLEKMGIAKDTLLSALNKAEEKRLTAELLALLRESQACISDDALVGTSYTLHSEVIRDGMDFMRMVDACGRLGKSGIGIGLCLREANLVEEATSLYLNIQSKLVSELSRLESEADAIKELNHIFYFFVQEGGVTGTLAGIVAEYICTGKPVIVLNKKDKVAEDQKDEETRISARCNKKLMSASGGIDLAVAMEQASGAVDGFGGGHPVAAGASIPKGSEEKFITALDTIIGKQRGQKK
ncbi:MAG: DHH family phosphoesterase [Methanomicrobia archaeon]|nr:DHH family phosphoesterase [Methanomicrobia archaeon]